MLLWLPFLKLQILLQIKTSLSSLSMQKKKLEGEAEEYLEDLVKRNLVIVTSTKRNGKIKCFGLHDMVREMCIRKAHDEKFLRVMDIGVVPQGMVNERRISFKHSGMDKLWGPTIRTILCFEPTYLHLRHDEYLSSPAFSESIRLVRVLDAGVVNSRELPSKVFDLFHLRYLALISSSNIPSAISSLTHLQTLLILTTDHQLKKRFPQKVKRSPSPYLGVGTDVILLEPPWTTVLRGVTDLSLPSEIWRMSELRHLVFTCSYILPDPPPDGSTLPLENLQTLWWVASLVCSERTFKLIPNIKRLRITYHKDEDYKLHNLVHLCKLQVLEVSTFMKYSSWQRQNPRFPCTLKKLSLFGTRLPWKDMAVVGALPNLQVLKIQCFAYDGRTWRMNDGVFLQLKFLLIEESNLQHWKTETNHFPRLQSLVLHHCLFLSQIPEISTLELIEVDDYNESLVDSAKQI